MRWTVLALFICSAPLTARAAQTPATPRPMKLVDLLDVPSLGDPQLSPDDREALYVLSAADWKADRTVTHIWRTNADGTGAPVQMTNGPRGESEPRWPPHSRMIPF